jgi:cysteine desulfurase family protein (TIGR01976 family)
MIIDQEAINYIRTKFPALQRLENDRQVVFFDGPAGTQVTSSVIEAMADYLVGCNSNTHGPFGTSIESDNLLGHAHQAMADFVNASDPCEIVFGQNMTSLTFAFSRALAKTWQPGDEILVTALDHDANVTPWVLAAKDAGAIVKFVDFRADNYLLDEEDFANKLSPKTKLVALGCASNATGGINNVKHLTKLAHDVGALVYLDAVHFGPHGLIDVADWNCDFLACSTYKFFGPHLGVLWGRRKLLEDLPAYKVRPSSNELPGKWMTGTQSHESIAGALACVDYLANLGRYFKQDTELARRPALEVAFSAIVEYERELSRHLIEGLKQIEGIKIYGIDDPDQLHMRFPTVSITHESVSTTELAISLGKSGVNVWNGNYYAYEFTSRLGLEPEGMVRIGLVHYNTSSEVDRLHDALQKIVSVTA